MKEFIRTLKQTMQVHVCDTITYAAIPVGGGILGVIIILIGMALLGPGEGYGMLGSMFALLFGAIALFFGGIFSVQNEFNLAVSMGRTRKHFVPARYLILALNVVLLEVIVGFWGWLEKVLYPALYPDAMCEMSLDGLTQNSGLLAGIAIGTPVLIMFLGVMLMKFTAKFFWVLWVIWMFGCIGVPRIAHAVTEEPQSAAGRFGLAVIDLIESFSTAGVIGVTSVVIIVGMIVTYWLFSKQRVTA